MKTKSSKTYICPVHVDPCTSYLVCARQCQRMHHNQPPINHVLSALAAQRPAVHFVGFTGEEWHSAVRIWGLPDIVHRVWDYRAKAEIAEGDIVIFAKYGPDYTPTTYSWNDSERF